MIKFERSKETEGWPSPVIHHFNIASLTDIELANYIEVSGFTYDGMSSTMREALVRLLRREVIND